MKEYAITLSYNTNDHDVSDYDHKLAQIRAVCRIELMVMHQGESRGVHFHGIIICDDNFKYSQLYDHGKDGMNIDIKPIVDKYNWIKYCYHEQWVYKDFVKQSCRSLRRQMDPTLTCKTIIERFNKRARPKKKQTLAMILNLKIFT